MRAARTPGSRAFLALLAGVLFSGLALFGAEARAQVVREPGGAAPAETDRPPAVGPANAREAKAFFDGLIPRQLREGHVAGATVAVVKDGRTVFAEGYGHADLEEREPVITDETLFFPGSAGKLFTWTAVMQLAEQGKIDLDADVETYLDFDVPQTYPEPITMADLMTHTAGFEEEFAAQLAEDGEGVLPLREFLPRHMPGRVYPPGEVYAYSNYGTALAGYVVERVSGEPYERYVTDHILEPLSMERSAAVQPLPTDLARDLSKGYHYREGTYDAKDFEWVSNAPSAPVHATATDMARFLLAHLEHGEYGGGRILEESTVLEMHRRQFTHDPRLPGTAFGFINSQNNGRRVLLHDGESARFSTLVALLPKERAGLFVSYNTSQEPFETLSAFMDRFYPRQRDGAPSPAQRVLPAGEVARWAGTYVPARAARTGPQKIVGWLDPLEARAEEGGLSVTSPFGEQRYVRTGPNVFRQPRGEWSLVFREKEGETRLFMGPFPLAYFEVPAYQTLGFQLPLIAACLALFVSAVVVFPAASLARRRRGGGSPPRAADSARLLAAILGALNLGLLAWFVVSLLGFAESYVWPTRAVSTITRLWLLSVPLTLGAVVLAVLAWKDRYWGAAGRVHYSLVALAAALFVVLLGNWNLIGW